MKKSIQAIVIFAIGTMLFASCCSTKTIVGEKTNVGGHTVEVITLPDGTELVYIDGVLQDGTNTACTTNGSTGQNCGTATSNSCTTTQQQPSGGWWNGVRVNQFQNKEQAGYGAYATDIPEGAEYNYYYGFWIFGSASSFCQVAKASSVAPKQTGELKGKPVYSYVDLYKEYGMVSH